MLELTHYVKIRIHNLKYFTWIEQQGRELSDLNGKCYGRAEYWQDIVAFGPQIDEMIVKFKLKIDSA